MKEYLNIENLQLSAKLSIFLAPLISLYSPVQHLITSLILLSVLDVLTGIYKNRIIHKRSITSRDFFKRKPVLILLWSIGLTAMLLNDKMLIDLGISGNWGAKAYCVFYGLYETLSILENLGECGVKGMNGIIKLLKGRIPSEYSIAIDEVKNEDKQ
jgi:phage-related holin